MSLLRAAAVAASAIASAPGAAAELNVVAAGAIRGIIDDYSRQTGIKFSFTVGPTGQLRDALSSGRPVDPVIVAAPLLAELWSRQDYGR